MSKRVDVPQGTMRAADAPGATAETAAASTAAGLPKSSLASERPKPGWAALTGTSIADGTAATEIKLEPSMAAKERSAAPAPKFAEQAGDPTAQESKLHTSRFALLAAAVAGAA